MARFPKVPGGGPKGMNNPIYWTRMHLQNKRYEEQSYEAIEAFNERLIRLRHIQNIVANEFVDEIIEDLEGKELEELLDHIRGMQYWNNEIEENIEIADNSHLSMYATQIKNVALMAINLCIKYGVSNNIETVKYNANDNTIYLNDELFYELD